MTRLAVALLLLMLTACARSADGPPPVEGAPRGLAGVTLTYYGDALESGIQVEQLLADRFEADTGVRVLVIPMAPDTTQSFLMARRVLEAGRRDVDVLNLDVVWVAALGDDLHPMPDALAAEGREHLPAIAALGLWHGRTVALPKFLDLGALFYRRDLLRAYGIAAPPATWEALARDAAVIQRGERAKNPAFWGFIWQGKEYEGLTCDALEWQTSEGVPLGRPGGLAVDRPGAVRAFARASGWLGTISPPWTTDLMESECRAMFQQGDAAFMRNWASHVALLDALRSPARGRFGVAPVPHGRGRSASALGGALLGVTRGSRHPDAAFAFVRYMTSAPVQAWRSRVGSYLPSRTALYDVNAPSALVAWFKPLLPSAVARPVDVTGARYPDASALYARGVSQILAGKAPGPIARVTQRALDELLGRPAGAHRVPSPIVAPPRPPRAE